MKPQDKAHLEPEEVLRVAVAALLRGIPHAIIAETLGVNNQGRITEAVMVMEWAAENHKMLYRYLKAQRARQRRENGKTEVVAVAEADPFTDPKLLETSH